MGDANKRLVKLIKSEKYDEIKKLGMVDVDATDIHPELEKALLASNGLMNVSNSYREGWKHEAIENAMKYDSPTSRLDSIIGYYDSIGRRYRSCFGNTRFLFSHVA